MMETFYSNLKWKMRDEPREHVHIWGQVEEARFSGNPHRKCIVENCRVISLDLEDEHED